MLALGRVSCGSRNAFALDCAQDFISQYMNDTKVAMVLAENCLAATGGCHLSNQSGNFATPTSSCKLTSWPPPRRVTRPLLGWSKHWLDDCPEQCHGVSDFI
jgi:hypothetical protein